MEQLVLLDLLGLVPQVLLGRKDQPVYRVQQQQPVVQEQQALQGLLE